MGSMGKPWSPHEFHAFSHASYTRATISTKKARNNPTSTGTRGGKQPASSKRKLQFTDDDVEEEDEQSSSLGKNT